MHMGELNQRILRKFEGTFSLDAAQIKVHLCVITQCTQFFWWSISCLFMLIKQFCIMSRKLCIMLRQRLALWVKFSADDILKYFSYFFPQKICFDISGKLTPLETIYMKCQNLFSGKNKININNVSSAELAKTKRVVRLNARY